MTRKINKNLKNVKKMMTDAPQVPELPPIEETWEKMMTVNKAEAEVSLKIAGRWDNYMNVRDLCYKVAGNWVESILESEQAKLFHEMHLLSIETYGKIVGIVKSWELDEFLKDEMKDYFEDHFKDPVSCPPQTPREMIEGSIVFLTMKPWAEKMIQLHQQILFEQSQREARAQAEEE